MNSNKGFVQSSLLKQKPLKIESFYKPNFIEVLRAFLLAHRLPRVPAISLELRRGLVMYAWHLKKGE